MNSVPSPCARIRSSFTVPAGKARFILVSPSLVTMISRKNFKKPLSRSSPGGRPPMAATCRADPRSLASPRQETAWDIHHVNAVDVCMRASAEGCKRGDDAVWTAFDQWNQLEEPGGE